MSAAHEHPPGSCRELLERLSEYLDGELDPATCAEIETHLGDCEPCVAFLRSLRSTVAHVGSLERAHLPDDVRRACIEAYEKRRR